eukprot:138542_1
MLITSITAPNMFFWLISSVIMYACNTQNQNTLCDDYKECSNNAVITCPAYSDILCYGSFACDSANSMSTGDDILCYGSRACANIPSIQYTAASGRVDCDGLESCVDSVFTMELVHCDGSKACIGTTMAAAAVVWGVGAYSLVNATIIADNKNINIHLYGYYAGYRMRLICSGTSVCEINCGGTGCNGIIVEGSGQWNISKDIVNDDIVISVDAIQKDTECTQTFDLSLKSKIFQGSADTISNVTGSICCRGHYSCSGIFSLNVGNNTLLCSGYQSCYNIGKIEAEQANIICEGRNGCTDSNMKTNGDVYCGGYLACSNSSITSSGNVYCAGQYSCASGANIYITPNSVSSIFLSGYLSGYGISIYCLSGAVCSIYCQGKSACSMKYTKVDCSEGQCNVYCSMDTSCPAGYTINPTQATTHPLESTQILSFCSVTNATNCGVLELTFEQDSYCCSYILGLETNDITSQAQLYKSVKLVKDLNIASLVCDWCFVIIACITFCCLLTQKYGMKKAKSVPLCITLFGSL